MDDYEPEAGDLVTVNKGGGLGMVVKSAQDSSRAFVCVFYGEPVPGYQRMLPVKRWYMTPDLQLVDDVSPEVVRLALVRTFGIGDVDSVCLDD